MEFRIAFALSYVLGKKEFGGTRDGIICLSIWKLTTVSMEIETRLRTPLVAGIGSYRRISISRDCFTTPWHNKLVSSRHLSQRLLKI